MSDQQNTVLAIVLSILVIVAFEFLYFAPQREAMERYTAQQEAAQQAAAIRAGDAPATPSAGDAPSLPGEAPGLPGEAPSLPGGGVSGASREEALAATARIEVRSPRLRGSISAEGGRIDDIVLTDYRETTDPESPQITLLSPQGSHDAYFTEFGGIGPDGPMPDRDTVWRTDGDLLTPENRSP